MISVVVEVSFVSVWLSHSSGSIVVVIGEVVTDWDSTLGWFMANSSQTEDNVLFGPLKVESNLSEI